MFGFKSPQRVVVVIDINATSVGAGIAVFGKTGSPLMPYTIRETISFPDEKRSPLCMLRAFESVLNGIENEGRAVLARSCGVHHIDRAIISLDAPWHDTHVETKRLGEDGKSFIFTRDMLARAVKERATLAKDRKELHVEVLTTLLNGYETKDPYGKRAEHAEILLLSSSMDGETMSLLSHATKRLRARGGVRLVPLTSLAHSVLRAQYPHDKDFLLLLVSEEVTTLVFAHHGVIMDVATLPVGLQHIAHVQRSTMRTLPVNGTGPIPPQAEVTEMWGDALQDALRGFASRHALPRMVFLVSADSSTDNLRHLLDSQKMHELWLSDESLTVIPVISKLLSSLIRHQGNAEADVLLDLGTLFAKLQMTKG